MQFSSRHSVTFDSHPVHALYNKRHYFDGCDRSKTDLPPYLPIVSRTSNVNLKRHIRGQSRSWHGLSQFMKLCSETKENKSSYNRYLLSQIVLQHPPCNRHLSVWTDNNDVKHAVRTFLRRHFYADGIGALTKQRNYVEKNNIIDCTRLYVKLRPLYILDYSIKLSLVVRIGLAISICLHRWKVTWRVAIVDSVDVKHAVRTWVRRPSKNLYALTWYRGTDKPMEEMHRRIRPVYPVLFRLLGAITLFLTYLTLVRKLIGRFASHWQFLRL